MKPLSEENKVFETEYLIAYHNGSGELFIMNKNDRRTEIRVGPEGKSQLSITAHDGSFRPAEFAGLGGFVVRGGRISVGSEIPYKFLPETAYDEFRSPEGLVHK